MAVIFSNVEKKTKSHGSKKKKQTDMLDWAETVPPVKRGEIPFYHGGRNGMK